MFIFYGKRRGNPREEVEDNSPQTLEAWEGH
jgi:hypothetical protein